MSIKMIYSCQIPDSFIAFSLYGIPNTLLLTCTLCHCSAMWEEWQKRRKTAQGFRFNIEAALSSHHQKPTRIYAKLHFTFS